MHRISFAPELSATFRRVSCWITGHDSSGPTERFGAQVAQMLGAAEHRSERTRWCVREERKPQRRRWAAWASKIRSASLEAWPSPGLLHDLEQAPALLLGDGARLGDADQVADAALVLLVVHLELGAVLDGLAVEAVGLGRADLDDDRLVHLVGDHRAEPDLALAARLVRRRRLGRCRGCGVGHLVSSAFLRVRLGLAAGTSGASSTAAAAGSGCGATAAGSRASATKVATIPKSRSRSTVMIRAMSCRTLLISLEFSS